MFPQFGATAESLSKASSLLLRFGTDAHLYDDPDDVNIGPLLDSRFDSEKVDALKRLLALLAQGADVSHHYPQVLNRSVLLSVPPSSYSSSSFVKPTLVELMSMNSLAYQPIILVTDRKTLVCYYHLSTLVVLCLCSFCECLPNFYLVEKIQLKYALPKLYDLHHDEDSAPLRRVVDFCYFLQLVDILLNDYSPGVVGAAAVAFKSVCPSSLYLIAKSFRRLCETLPDVEERSQIVLIEILLRYVIARHGLVKESSMFTSNSVLTSQEDENFAAFGGMLDNHHSSLAGMACDSIISSVCKCYIEGQRDCSSQAGRMKGDNDLDLPLTSSTNDDVDILLQCTSPLLWSHNSAVVFGAATVHWIMAPREEVERIIKPVLFILRSCQPSKYVASDYFL
ncbi:unnamed protein product [Musa textilis]